MQGRQWNNRLLIAGAALGALAWFAFAGGVAARSPAGATGQTQTQQKTDQKSAATSQAAQTPAAPATDPQEDAAYKAFFDLKPADLDPQIQAGEQFLQKYPQSRYRETIYARLTQAYFHKQEMDKMFAAADKALAITPDDYTVLVTVGWVIPHTTSGGDAESDKKLDLAERYSKRALELLPTITKPASVSDADFVMLKNEALAQGHSGLGLVYFRRGDFEKSMPELEQATTIVPNPDPTDLFVLGVDNEQLKHYGAAHTSFESCGKIAGGLQEQCKQNAERTKKLAATELVAPKP
jgi:tetratricopeptide (TPR) repeat protein